MIRFTKALVAVAAALTLPSMASALGIASLTATSSGASNTVLLPGETITFDVIVENDSQQDIFGLDVVVSGFDSVADYFGNVDGHLSLSGGAVTNELFSGLPNVGFPTGLENQLTAPELLHTANLLAPPEFVRVGLFGGVAFSAVNGTGGNDDGVNGTGLVSGGGIHFQVQFTATPQSVAGQTINLNFGVDPSLGHIAVGQGGATLPFTNAGYTLHVVPEPGTALLMGLGLAGLAGVRRR